ncbi:hypothetical protein PC128_g10878 [Phytophthora cactorum]|nr:hypothetical protein PC128_g10878 [Phytophthora cactorum]
MASAKDMWDTLVSDHTQRDFSYATLLKRQLYQCSLEPGQTMADYVRPMTQLRQRLRNMDADHAISDGDMTSLLLMGVAMTHRELLEQFDLPTRQGNPPTLQQVTNSLRSRDERDRMMDQAGAGIAMVMNMTSSGVRTFPGGGGAFQGPGSRNGFGGNWAPGTASGAASGTKKAVRCYHCKKMCHFRRDCLRFKTRPKKASGNTEKPSGKGGVQRKGKQSEKASNNDKQKPGMIKHMQ